ncbi:MAG: hypothetical protein AAFQ35_03940 [Pseudomonadota bacterium]
MPGFAGLYVPNASVACADIGLTTHTAIATSRAPYGNSAPVARANPE